MVWESLHYSSPISLFFFISAITGEANRAQQAGAWSLLCLHSLTDAVIFPVPDTTYTLSPKIFFFWSSLYRRQSQWAPWFHFIFPFYNFLGNSLPQNFSQCRVTVHWAVLFISLEEPLMKDGSHLHSNLPYFTYSWHTTDYQ